MQVFVETLTGRFTGFPLLLHATCKSYWPKDFDLEWIGVDK